MNSFVYWWFVWNRLKRFSNRWSPDSSRSSKLGFWRRSLGLATRFVRFVQGLACNLVMSVNSLQSTCYKVRPVRSRSGADVSGRPCWCATTDLLLLMLPFHPWCLCNSIILSVTVHSVNAFQYNACMMNLYSADPLETASRWPIHCIISFTTTKLN